MKLLGHNLTPPSTRLVSYLREEGNPMAQIDEFINAKRLDIYVKHLKVKKSQAMAAYHWNKHLAAAIMPALQCMEVTLRNAIDLAVQSAPPKGAVGLWQTDRWWVSILPEYMGNTLIQPTDRYKLARNAHDRQDAQGFQLNSRGRRVLNRKLTEETQPEQAKNQIRAEGKAITSERIIAGLTFGFWTTLMTDKYEDLSSDRLLWPGLFSEVFPHAPAGFGREDVKKVIFRIKDLRNRVSHHEAVWKFSKDNPATGRPDPSRPVYGAAASCSLLNKHYDDILDVIGWINPDRLKNFLSHGADRRFRALCSVDGLNAYCNPAKIRQTAVIPEDKPAEAICQALLNSGYTRLIQTDGSELIVAGTDIPAAWRPVQ